jgi:hypothetical protein
MTYEEALAEIEYRAKELGGIGKHATVEAAKRADDHAVKTFFKLVAAVEIVETTIMGGGYEHYLAK